MKLIKQIEGQDDLAFKLEHELLKIMSQTQETTTQPVSSLAAKEDTLDPVVEKQANLTEQLNKLF